MVVVGEGSVIHNAHTSVLQLAYGQISLPFTVFIFEIYSPIKRQYFTYVPERSFMYVTVSR
jgi:hypothetical protein